MPKRPRYSEDDNGRIDNDYFYPRYHQDGDVTSSSRGIQNTRFHKGDEFPGNEYYTRNEQKTNNETIPRSSKNKKTKRKKKKKKSTHTSSSVYSPTKTKSTPRLSSVNRDREKRYHSPIPTRRFRSRDRPGGERRFRSNSNEFNGRSNRNRRYHDDDVEDERADGNEDEHYHQRRKTTMINKRTRRRRTRNYGRKKYHQYTVNQNEGQKKKYYRSKNKMSDQKWGSYDYKNRAMSDTNVSSDDEGEQDMGSDEEFNIGRFKGKRKDCLGPRDRYQIVKRLGTGTFASVFCCEDRTFHRIEEQRRDRRRWQERDLRKVVNDDDDDNDRTTRNGEDSRQDTKKGNSKRQERNRYVAMKIIRAVPRYVKEAVIEMEIARECNRVEETMHHASSLYTFRRKQGRTKAMKDWETRQNERQRSLSRSRSRSVVNKVLSQSRERQEAYYNNNNNNTNTRSEREILETERRFFPDHHSRGRRETANNGRYGGGDYDEGEYPCYIIKLLNAFSWGKHYCLVFEQCGPSLYAYMKNLRYQPFSLQKVIVYGRAILRGIAFLHSIGYTHTDLKVENILLTNPGSNEVKCLEIRGDRGTNSSSSSSSTADKITTKGSKGGGNHPSYLSSSNKVSIVNIKSFYSPMANDIKIIDLGSA
eukprot:g359.t1